MAFLVYFGLQLGKFHTHHFVCVFLGPDSSVRGRWSFDSVSSIVTFPCRFVCFPTCLKGWINSFLLFSALLLFL